MLPSIKETFTKPVREYHQKGTIPLKYENIKTGYKTTITMILGFPKSGTEEVRASKKQTINGTELGNFMTNKNYYKWSQYKVYKYGAQKGGKAKQVI